MPWDPRRIVGETDAPTTPERRRGCLVTGTDTDVGKSVVTAAIVARLREQGQAVRAVKPLAGDPPA